jgi:hypothetical protein
MCQSGTTCLVYLRSFSELAHLTKRVGIVQSGHHLIEMQLTLTIIWLSISNSELDLQLPMQSEPITTKFVSWNPVHGEVYSIQHHLIKSVIFSWYSSFLLASPLSMQF